MRNSWTGVACLASVLIILFIADFSVALSRNAGTRHRRSPKFIVWDSSRDNLANYIPARWRLPSSELRPPEIEIQLLKGHVPKGNENWAFSSEYRYSSKDYRPQKNMESLDGRSNGNQLGEEVKENDQDNRSENNILKTDGGGIPQIGNRNIIVGPTYCPSGQRPDSNGVCREVIDP